MLADEGLRLSIANVISLTGWQVATIALIAGFWFVPSLGSVRAVLALAAVLLVGNATADLGLPLRAYLTWVALAAALMGEELSNATKRIPQIDRVVEDHDGTGANRATHLPEVFEGQSCIQMLGCEKGPGRPAGQDGVNRPTGRRSRQVGIASSV